MAEMAAKEDPEKKLAEVASKAADTELASKIKDLKGIEESLVKQKAELEKFGEEPKKEGANGADAAAE